MSNPKVNLKYELIFLWNSYGKVDILFFNKKQLMVSIVIISSCNNWLDASVMTNFDVLWHLSRILTFFKIKKIWKYCLTKIDACVNLNLRQLTSIFVSWVILKAIFVNRRQLTSKIFYYDLINIHFKYFI